LYVHIKNGLNLENPITNKFCRDPYACANGDSLVLTKLLTPVGDFRSL